jgi:cytochrome c-type biogenesis protein CcmH/NrfG
MSEPEMKDVLDRYQRSNRRWKILALVSTSVLAVLFLATGVSSIVRWKQVEAARELALQMQQEAMAQRDRPSKCNGKLRKH